MNNKQNLWRIISLALALVMLFSVVACGNDTTAETSSTEASIDTTTANSTTGTETPTTGTEAPTTGTETPTTGTTETPTTSTTEAPSTEAPSTEAPTTGTTASSASPDAPSIDPVASVYSGTPDTSWYSEGKTEFTLTSADQLMGFQELRGQEKSFEGVTVKLGCDVVINQGTTAEIQAKGKDNYVWKDLHSNNSFKGTFDGQGHTISGIYMQLTTAAVSSMFGSLAGKATLKNFNMVNSYFGAPDSKDGKATLAGLVSKIAAEGSEVTIKDVNVALSITEKGHIFHTAAGLVGSVDGAVTLTIENCAVYGDITITGNRAAGMVAYVSNADALVTLTNCTSYADITAAQYCGSMVGQSVAKKMTVVGCVNLGELKCEQNCNDLIGDHKLLYDPYNGEHPTIAEGTTALRVMSFNVQGSLPKTNGLLDAPALNRVEAVRQEILYYSPDLLGLQEDNWYWLNALELDDYNIIQDSGNGSSVTSERCAIYYKKGMKLLESGTYWMTVDGTSATAALTYADLCDPNSKFYMTDLERERLLIYNDADLKESRKDHWDETTGQFATSSSSYTPITTRKFTYGVFEINGQIIIYVNTHLTNRGQNADYSNEYLQKIRSLARVAEWDNLMEKVSKIQARYEGGLSFFTGDFNDNIGTAIFETITKEYNYISAAAVAPEHVGPYGSWNSAFKLADQGDNYPQNAHLEGTTTSGVDYCFVQNGITINRYTVGAGKATITATDGSTKTIYTSDHLPIITDLSFKTATTGKPIVPDHSSDPVEDLTKPDVFDGLADISWYTGDKDEYILTTAEQFAGFFVVRQNGKGKITFKGVTIKLARDLIFNEGTVEEFLKNDPYQLEALNSNYLFEGTFDGQGHYISGIYMQCASAGKKGLFGGLGDNGTIKNLTIKNSYAGSATGSNKSGLAILVSRVLGKNTLISNVTIDGFYMKENTKSFKFIGALVGYMEKDGDYSLTIENCVVKNGTFDFGTKGSQIGGLVGAALSGASITVKNSYVTDVTINAVDLCGGLIGNDASGECSIDNASDFTGTINCPGAKGDKIGNS